MLWLLFILSIINHSATKSISDQLIELVTQGSFRSVTYNRLAALVDTIGPRLCGNESLTYAVDWVRQAMINEGLDNVHVEEIQIPH